MAKSVADPVLVMSDVAAVPPLVIASYILALTVPVSRQFFRLSAPTVATIVVAVVAAGLAIAGLVFTEWRLVFTEWRFVLRPFGSGLRARAEGVFP